MAEHDTVYVNGEKQEKRARKVKCPRPTEGPHYIDWEGVLLKRQKADAEKAKKIREKKRGE